MGATFTGMKSVGGHRKSNNRADDVTPTAIGWDVLIVGGDGPATNVAFVPGQNVLGWQFELDPVSVQSSFTFGAVKGMQATINRPKSYYVDGTHNFMAGRVFIYIPSSGQLFIFSPKEIVEGTLGTAFVNESVMLMAPLRTALPSKAIVTIEQDGLINGTEPSATAYSELFLTMFNYDVPPVGSV